jgi:hypothetical protein
VLRGASGSAITYSLPVEWFYSYILGCGMVIDTNREDMEEMAEDPGFLEMPAYPAAGYCKMIGDKVVVKMEEQPDQP